MREVKPIREDKIDEFKSVLKEKNIRDYIMFELGLNLGLRISDILKLRVKDVHNKDILYIVEQKTDKFKEVPISPQLKKELKKYCENKAEYEYLIKSRKGFNEPIKRQRAYRILKDVSKMIGIERIGTHSMRKTFGRKYYKRFNDMEELRKYFNHDRVETTRRYIGVEQEEINKKIRSLWS